LPPVISELQKCQTGQSPRTIPAAKVREFADGRDNALPRSNMPVSRNVPAALGTLFEISNDSIDSAEPPLAEWQPPALAPRAAEAEGWTRLRACRTNAARVMMTGAPALWSWQD